MINDSGYFYPDETGACDTRYELSVNSAGRYKLIRRESFETIRPAGRNDFQLLYLAGGSADFVIGGKKLPSHRRPCDPVLSRGTAVLSL